MTSTHVKQSADQRSLDQLLARYTDLFTISPAKLKEITSNFVHVLQRGLDQDGQTVRMFPAYVFGFPSGMEAGKYLALDLGGTNLRVCLVELKGDRAFAVTQSKFKLTEEQKHCEGSELFDFCAQCLGTFVDENIPKREDGTTDLEHRLPLGFTFSYPMEQDKIDHGLLVRWTKGFGNPNTEGMDVATMFRASLKKFNIPIRLVSLINDTTGTLVASHYVNPDVKIACIFGTGCNAAYMEHVGQIPKFTKKHPEVNANEEMAINCEYGAFDSYAPQYLPRTKYDEHIDMTSNKPTQQVYEKMIAGLYLGELFRLCLSEMIDEGKIFVGQNTYKLDSPFVFDTAFLSLMEADPTPELLTITGLFSHFFALETTLPERKFFRSLAQLIGTRAARLSACGIAALVTKMGLADVGCGVGADGSLFSKYPGFTDRQMQALRDIFGEENGNKIKLYQAEDGSGVGSAIIAAMTKTRWDQGIYKHL